MQNIGTMDKLIRLTVGTFLIALAIGGVVPWWAGAIGLVPVATALINVCPAYFLIGLNTRKAEETDQQGGAH